MERREYTRISCQMDAVLFLPDDQRQQGMVRDISFGGAYLDCDSKESCRPSDGPSNICTLELRMANGHAGGPIRIRCQVVEVMRHRVGIRFTGADAPDYERLRQFLLRNAPDSAALLEEMRVFPNPAFSEEFHLPGFTHWLKRMLDRLKQQDAA